MVLGVGIACAGLDHHIPGHDESQETPLFNGDELLHTQRILEAQVVVNEDNDLFIGGDMLWLADSEITNTAVIEIRPPIGRWVGVHRLLGH